MACKTCMDGRKRLAKLMGIERYKRALPSLPLRPEDEEELTRRSAGIEGQGNHGEVGYVRN